MYHIDKASYGVEGFLKISDVNTGEVLVDKKNAIHFGNLTASVTEVLAGIDASHMRFLAFGNGGTIVTPSQTPEINEDGTVIYKAPNVGKRKSLSASMHSEIYSIELNYINLQNRITYLSSNSDYADIILEAVLDLDDIGDNQHNIDRASTYNEYAMIDELAIFSGPSTEDDRYYNLGLSTRHKMVTHVVFHPIQKTKNRKIKIDYVVRVYMVPVRSSSIIPMVPYKKPDPLQAHNEFMWSPFMTLSDTYDFSATTYIDKNTTKNIVPLRLVWNENSSMLALEFFRSYQNYNQTGYGNGFVNIDILNGAFGVMSSITYYADTAVGFSDLASDGNNFSALLYNGRSLKYDTSSNNLSLNIIPDSVRAQINGSNIFTILGDSSRLFGRRDTLYLYDDQGLSTHYILKTPLAMAPFGAERDFIAAFNVTDSLTTGNNGHVRWYTYKDNEYVVESELSMPMDFDMSGKTVITNFNSNTFLITTTGGESTNMAVVGVRGGELKILHYVGKGYVNSTSSNPSVVIAIPPKHIVISDSTTFTLSIYEVLADI